MSNLQGEDEDLIADALEHLWHDAPQRRAAIETEMRCRGLWHDHDPDDPCDCEQVPFEHAQPVADARDALARWMFERSDTWRDLCSPEDADWDEWVERNREEWREEIDALLASPALTAYVKQQEAKAVLRYRYPGITAAELAAAVADPTGDPA